MKHTIAGDVSNSCTVPNSHIKSQFTINHQESHDQVAWHERYSLFKAQKALKGHFIGRSCRQDVKQFLLWRCPRDEDCKSILFMPLGTKFYYFAEEHRTFLDSLPVKSSFLLSGVNLQKYVLCFSKRTEITILVIQIEFIEVEPKCFHHTVQLRVFQVVVVLIRAWCWFFPFKSQLTYVDLLIRIGIIVMQNQ